MKPQPKTCGKSRSGFRYVCGKEYPFGIAICPYCREYEKGRTDMLKEVLGAIDKLIVRQNELIVHGREIRTNKPSYVKRQITRIIEFKKLKKEALIKIAEELKQMLKEKE